MKEKKNNNPGPAKEYRGKLTESTSFGETIYAFGLEPESDPNNGIHLGPFVFDRPIEAYVGQQVQIQLSADRTELGIFAARMRWINPKPIDRKGGRSNGSKKKRRDSRPNNQKRKPKRRRDQSEKQPVVKKQPVAVQEPSPQQKKLQAMLSQPDHVFHPLSEVAFALSMSEEKVMEGLTGLESLISPQGGISTAGVRILSERNEA